MQSPVPTAPAPQAVPAAPRPASITAIPHVRVFVADSADHVIEDATVVIRGDLVDVVGPAAEVPVPAGARVVEGRGRTLLPGLIDLHVHLEGSALPFDVPIAGDPLVNARAALACGVTALLDLHGREDVLFPLRDAERSGASPELPRLFVAGLAITAPAGHGTEGGFPGRVAADAEAAAAHVEQLAGKHADVVKLVFDGGNWGDFGALPTLAEDALAAAIGAAHAHGLAAVVHAVDSGFALRAIEDGADALAHLPFAGDIDDAWIASALAHKIVVMPTLAVAQAMFAPCDDAAWFDVPLVAECVDPRVPLAFADPVRRERLRGSERARFFRDRFGASLALVKRLHDAGVPLVLGTDAGNPAVCPGDAAHRELAAWVTAGVPPADALIAATSAAARFLGKLDAFGTIAPGKKADLVLVEGNPTKRIEDLRHVVEVWKDGRSIDRDAVTRALADRARRRPLDVAASAPAGEDALAFDSADGALPPLQTTTDAPDGGGSRIEALAARDYGDENRSGFLRLRGEVVVKPPAGGFASVVFPVASGRLSGARSLRFRVRADRTRAIEVLLHTADVLDQDWFHAPASATKHWSDVEVAIGRFVQVGFGRRVEFAPARVTAIEVRIGADLAGPFVVDLDDVTWTR